MPHSQVILITGATIGLGLATAQALVDSIHGPTTIILTSRNPVKGQASVDRQMKLPQGSQVKVVVKQLQLEDDKSIENLKREIETEFGKLDVLVNNAAVNNDFSIGDGPGKMSLREAFNSSCNTNLASTHILVHTLAPLLFASPTRRLIFISTGLSSMSHQSDPTWPPNKPAPEGWPKPYTFNVTAYRSSKAGVNMMALEWARVLRHDGFKIHILDPGFLATTFGGLDPAQVKGMGALEPSVGGEFVRDVIMGKRDGDVEKLLSKDGVLAW